MRYVVSCLILLISPFTVAAERDDTAAATPPAPAQERQSGAPAAGSGAGNEMTRIDRIHKASEELVQRTVGRIDAFFVDEEYATFADNDTRVRLRLDAAHFENSGWDVAPRVRLQLVMPGLQQRLRLVVNDGDTDEPGQPSGDDSKDNDIALRWITNIGKQARLSYDVGVRVRSTDVDQFFRINAGASYPVSGAWSGQTSNRLYYYLKDGWRNDFTQHFDRRLSDDLLFRSRSRIQYFQQNGYNPSLEQKFSVFQTLNSKSVLAWEALWRRKAEEQSIFGTDDLLIDPQERYDQYAVQLRYRRNVGRPWFFVEFWPIVLWPEERDWQTTLAARVRLEINLGTTGTLQLDD